jgi:hypothetical protein
MIKFFRKIRQNLLSEGKTSKYFKYAIGEIILVVIGILIALSINTWNENRKIEIEEIRLLTDLHSELEKTLSNTQMSRDYTLTTMEDIDTIEYYIKNDLPYSKELDNSFGKVPHQDVQFPSATAFNSIKAKGIGIIKNNVLKKDIINMYEVQFSTFADYNTDENLIRSSVVFPFYSKNILYSSELSFDASPSDFDALKKDKEFLNILRLVKRQRRRGAERYDEVITHLTKLIEDVKNELISRS